MLHEELMFVGTCDFSGHVRGKGFPASELAARRQTGIGWTHSNLMMSPFGPIYDTPFGTAGDLMIVPDPDAEVRVDFADGSPVEHFFLGDIRTTDGAAWECCPREFLRRGLASLREAAGLELIAAIEQEFVYTGVEARPGDAYGLGAFRRQGGFGGNFMAALRAGGVEPDSFLAEYGPRQFEVTVAPVPGLRAADRAVIVREMARAVAQRMGQRAIFAPMVTETGVGNGVHIHFSLRSAAGLPATHDADGKLGLSGVAEAFSAGVLAHLPAICAVTAPSPVSYLRLTPNRWAPTAVDLRAQDRGAALRVCPVFGAVGPEDRARRFNLEFRVADAAASPYMALGAVVFAGADGIRRGLKLPQGGSERALPRSLEEALELLRGSEQAAGWFGEVMLDAYLRFKRAEIQVTREDNAGELCARYMEVY